jgi:hypothetical protein
VLDQLARRRMRDVRRGDLQQLVDDMKRRGLSAEVPKRAAARRARRRAQTEVEARRGP